MSFFEAEALSAGYGRGNIVENISFSAESGSITCILGANGSGKTTLLKALCGLLPHEGRCVLMGQTLEGRNPRQMARLVGYIPQRSGIAMDISALDVVLMGFNPQLHLLERPTAAMIGQAMEALDRVGLGGRERENYLTLSEGQKQLCILARTLVGTGKLLLLDEPESALDLRHRNRLLGILREWAGEGRCVILTLHDPALALNGCDRLLLLDGGRLGAVLHPQTDPMEKMEEALSKIYGNVTLTRCTDKTGKSHLVMLKEELR